VQAILNPNIGKYKVQAQAGPAYATQRQEAWNAFVQIVTGAPDLINEIGDLMFLAADFPMADLIAERMRRKIKQMAPWLLDDNAVNPQVQQLQQQIQEASQQISELLQQLGEKDRKLKDQTRDINIKRADVVDKFRKTDIAAYGAHTQRIAAIANTESDMAAAGQTGEFTRLIQQIVKETLKEPSLDEQVTAPKADVTGDSGADLSRRSAAQADFSTPRLAPDGSHYIRHKGQHYKVDTKALLANGGAGPPQPAGGGLG
jgi:TolA-binding protein